MRSIILFFYRWMFPQTGRFLITDSFFVSKVKDVTPENGEWREVEMEGKSLRIILDSVGNPNVDEIINAAAKGRLVKLTVIE